MKDFFSFFFWISCSTSPLAPCHQSQLGHHRSRWGQGSHMDVHTGLFQPLPSLYLTHKHLNSGCMNTWTFHICWQYSLRINNLPDTILGSKDTQGDSDIAVLPTSRVNLNKELDLIVTQFPSFCRKIGGWVTVINWHPWSIHNSVSR